MAQWDQLWVCHTRLKLWVGLPACTCYNAVLPLLVICTCSQSWVLNGIHAGQGLFVTDL